MKSITRVIIFLLAVWLMNHPNMKALIKGVTSVTVTAPIAKAKSDFRTSAEKRAQQEAEARMKQIDKAIDSADQN
jgi:ribosomal protein L12E/L44/L45/RPP1/RPP2